MARKKTSTSKEDVAQEPVDETPEAETSTEDSDADAADVSETDDAEATVTEELPAEESPEITPESEETLEQPEVTEMTGPEVDESAERDQTTPPAPQTQPEAEKKGGFMPMVLGGLVAGGLGFGAAYFALPQSGGDLDAFRADVTAQLEKQSSELSKISSDLSGLPDIPDLTGLEAQTADLSAVAEALSDRIAGAEDMLAALDARLTTVEKRPIAEGASDAAVAAYERELKALQDAMAAQRSEIEAMTVEARNMEDNAAETARATMQRAALTRIQTALDTGMGFAPALGDLVASGIDVPEALVAVADEGVASLTQLQDSFPEAARAALGVSRQEAASKGEQSGFATFLKNQLGTRSLEPREGDDPDAVLSRAEAAMRDGRLTDALAELEALPDVGKDALSDWVSQVNNRQEALAAAEELGQKLN